MQNTGYASISIIIRQRFSLTTDKILMYGYVKPRVQWFPNEEDPPTDLFRIAWGSGTIPSGTLARTLWRRNPAKPDYNATSAWDSGVCLSTEAPGS
jgi:hypothetical protein